MLTGITHLFRTLPAAMKQRDEAVRANDGTLGGDDDYDDDDDDEDAEEEDWTNVVEDQEWGNVGTADVADTKGDIKDESQAYLDFLSEEASHQNVSIFRTLC